MKIKQSYAICHECDNIMYYQGPRRFCAPDKCTMCGNRELSYIENDGTVEVVPNKPKKKNK